MAKAMMKISTEELAAYYIPEPFWPKGHPHPSWVDEPLIYTSARVAQEPLEIQKERDARTEMMKAWVAADRRSIHAMTQPTLF